MKVMKLRPYQKKDHREILNLWGEYQSVLYQLNTGGGKTVIFNSIIDSCIDSNPNEKILILKIDNWSVVIKNKTRHY